MAVGKLTSIDPAFISDLYLGPRGQRTPSLSWENSYQLMSNNVCTISIEATAKFRATCPLAFDAQISLGEPASALPNIGCIPYTCEYLAAKAQTMLSK